MSSNGTISAMISGVFAATALFVDNSGTIRGAMRMTRSTLSAWMPMRPRAAIRPLSLWARPPSRAPGAQVRFLQDAVAATTTVQVRLAGSGVTDMEIVLSGLHTLTAADFLL